MLLSSGGVCRNVHELELEPVRVVEEDRVVAGRIVVLLRAALDLGALLAKPGGTLVDLPAIVLSGRSM